MSLQPPRILAVTAVVATVLAMVSAVPAQAAAGASSPNPAPPAGASLDQRAKPAIMGQALAESESAPADSSGPFKPQQRLQPRTGAMSPDTHTAGTAGAANSGLRREVFGYVNAGNLGNATFGYGSYNYSLLSTVAYFGLEVNSGDGNLVTTDTPWSVWNSATMSNFIAKAHANGTRVIVSINITAADQVCNGLLHTQPTIQQTVQQVQSHGVDGVNIDYETSQQPCGTSDARTLMTSFVHAMRTALGSTYYLAVDTYASSAGDPGGFFDIPGMAPDVDSFFVMAYDTDESNYNDPPLNCGTYCLSPVSPAGGSYYFNDTRAAREYSSAVSSAKVILGLPYYSRGACVTSWVPNSKPAPGWGTYALPYRTSVMMATDPTNNQYELHRDGNDPGGQDSWSTWYSTNTSCGPQEMYWDDATAMGAKYDVVNNYNLRGAGLFTLDYAGAATELWNELATHFTLVPGAPGSVATCSSASTSATISWTPSPSAAGVRYYQVTASPGGASVAVTGTFATLTGLSPNTSYTIRITPHNDYGAGIAVDSGVWTAATQSSSYFSWYDLGSPGMSTDNIHLLNLGGSTSLGCVTVAGVRVQRFSVGAGQEKTIGLQPGDIGGPVSIAVTSGPALIATQRVKYQQSFNEIAAQAPSAASTSLWFPWYDALSSGGIQADNIHVINPGSSTANVSVAIPGCSAQGAAIPAGGYQMFSCATGFGGPVSITSDNPVLASQRVKYYQSFNEVVAQPIGAAATAIDFSWFDRVSSSSFVNGTDNIHVVNPGTPSTTAHVTVTIPGCPPQQASVAGGAGQLFTCANGFGGPVTVTSDIGVLASQRVRYEQSFNEVAGTPTAAAATSLHFTWFDRISDAGFLSGADNVHVLNPGVTAAAVTVSIPGCGPQQATIQPGQEQIFSCSSGFGGPVSVSASSGAVIASQRVQYYSTFNETAAN